MSDYLDVNRAMWDERAAPHAASPGYAVEQFESDPTFLSYVVRFDRERLGDISGLRGVHLQCHIGTDTISLSRLGARMTGLDFSTAAIEQARGLAQRTGADVEFVHAEFDAAPQVLPAHAFDLVYTGIGALCWLPSIERWAEVVAGLLAPGGRVFVREGHPMLWALDDTTDEGLRVEYPYFERPEPLDYAEDGTYVETDHQFTNIRSLTWNHGLGEVVTALLDRDLRLTMLVEHDSVPWDALPGQMERIAGEEYRLVDRPWRLAHTYTLQAVAPATPG
jgi:SAM-dependent methyltransferase